jgi:hypothetical protein
LDNVNLFEQTLLNLTSKLVAEEMKLKTRNNDVMNPTDVFCHTPIKMHFCHQQSAAKKKNAHDARSDYRGGRRSLITCHVTEVLRPIIEAITTEVEVVEVREADEMDITILWQTRAQGILMSSKRKTTGGKNQETKVTTRI